MLISAGDIIRNSWQIFAQNFKKLIIYMVLLFVPNMVLGLAAVVSLYLDNYARSGAFVMMNNIIIIAIIVASIVFTIWVAMALTKNLGAIIVKKSAIGAKESFTTTSGLIWPVIYTSILVMLIVLGGTIMLIIPGIIFSIWYTFTYYAIIFEEKKGVAALKASKELVTGRWWAIFWRLFAPGLFYALILIIITYAITYGLAYMLSGMTYVLVNGILTSIVSSIISPLTALVTIVLYYSAKENPVQVAPPTQEKK